MSDKVAVMNNGKFEQIDTPQNLYQNPSSAFVAQFVGDNNKFVGVMRRENGNSVVEAEGGLKFLVSQSEEIGEGERAEMYVRPEAIIINPSEQEGLNRIKTIVKAILFDGGNSRLLLAIDGSKKELLVSLPQNRQYDNIKVDDMVHVGWDPSSNVCFKETGVRTYEELE